QCYIEATRELDSLIARADASLSDQQDPDAIAEALADGAKTVEPRLGQLAFGSPQTLHRCRHERAPDQAG
ncbi:hypothetical protein AB0136_26530, partial [Klebsiella pneumoniae]